MGQPRKSKSTQTVADGSRLVQAAGYVMPRSGRLKNARRGDVRCDVFEKMMSGCKGFAEGLRRRGKVRIDEKRCIQAVKYIKQWLVAVVSANEG